MHLKHPDDPEVLRASLKFGRHLRNGDVRTAEDAYAALKNIQKLDDEAEERHQAALALKQKAVEAEALRESKKREAALLIDVLGTLPGDKFQAMFKLMISDIMYGPTGNSAKREKCLRSVDNCVTKAIQHAASEKERTVLHSVRNVIRRLIRGD